MTITSELRQHVRLKAANCCGYCRSNQRYLPYSLEIEHIIPRSRGGSDDESNLWLACRSCNMYKSNQTSGRDPQSAQTVPLFHPRLHRWPEHFQWSEDGVRVVGKTAIGRATVIRLQLNNIFAVTARHNWVTAGWHPPR